MNNSRVRLDKRNISKEFVLVEYPGLVKNDDKMLATLGGTQKVSEVLCGQVKRLEVHFHPKNLYNKSLKGDAHPTAGLLIKVKIRKPKNPDSKESILHTIEILGHCSTVYRFESLCDFQFLPIVKDPNTGQTQQLYKDIVPKGIMDIDYFNKPNNHLFCPPFEFARYDAVWSKMHRDDEDEIATEVLGVTASKNYDSRDVVAFSLTDPLPQKPYTLSIKKMTVKYVTDIQLEQVKKLFDETPIWNRIALLHESDIPNDKLKYILPSVAYYFSTGPWRTMYVRYGYDPRKDFNSRCFQTFDYRLTYGAGVAEYVKIKSLTKKSGSDQKYASLVQDINYPYFEEGKLPRSRQCIFRYHDIHVSKIQEMLQKIPTPLTGATCNEKTGWLPPGFDEQCRQILASSIKVIMKEFYQNQQLKYGEEEEDDVTDDEEPDEDDDIADDEELEENCEELLADT